VTYTSQCYTAAAQFSLPTKLLQNNTLDNRRKFASWGRTVQSINWLVTGWRSGFESRDKSGTRLSSRSPRPNAIWNRARILYFKISSFVSSCGTKLTPYLQFGRDLMVPWAGVQVYSSQNTICRRQHYQLRTSTGPPSRVGQMQCLLHVLFASTAQTPKFSWLHVHAETSEPKMKISQPQYILRPLMVITFA
jgi:hypothetical protein